MTLLYGGCTTIEYPNEFVRLIKFNSNIVAVEEERIFSKDELIEFIFIGNTAYDGSLMYHVYRLDALGLNENSVICIKPLSREKSVLDENVYEFGMPIIMGKSFSKQHVIMVKGSPMFWADSSYQYEDNTYTILPVCDSDDDGYDLNFTWTIN
jgi:hypothetical protein